ncbi:unnamed protein product [Effrenium voratum]|nr:unnamed protein product [Effrenium voratum]
MAVMHACRLKWFCVPGGLPFSCGRSRRTPMWGELPPDVTKHELRVLAAELAALGVPDQATLSLIQVAGKEEEKEKPRIQEDKAAGSDANVRVLQSWASNRERLTGCQPTSLICDRAREKLKRALPVIL